MNKRYYLELLQQAWIDFLQRRGHEVSVPEPIIDVITSYCQGHNSFRWLLFAAAGQIKRLRGKDLEEATARIVPIADQMRGEIDELRRWGKVNARPAS